MSIKEQRVTRLSALSKCSITQSTFSSTSTRLYHMGHSHSHHHHDHNEKEEEETNITPQQKRTRFQRRLALLAVVWMATCGASLLLKHRLAKSDWTSFAVASIVLSSADKARRVIRSNIQKLTALKDGIVKHAPMHRRQTNSLLLNPKLQQDASEADRVTWIGAIMNLVLSVGKLVIGITQHSSALVADAGHSLSDLVSDFITLWTVKIARLPADEDHPYGHWKFEAIGSLFLSLTLIATALSVGAMANRQLMEILHSSGNAVKAAASHHGHSHAIVPGKLALVMAAISIASKEWLYRITKKVGEKIRSQVVIANAWHHRSDAYSSVLALASIAWARTGFVAADAGAGLLVAGMIGMTGGEILMESVQQLSDGASPGLQKEAEEHCAELLQKDADDVTEISFVKARQVGSLSLVEVELLCPTNLSTTASRAVEERWKFWLQQLYGYEATVHAKPQDLICPLLKQQKKKENGGAGGNSSSHQHSHDHHAHASSDQQQQHLHDHGGQGQGALQEDTAASTTVPIVTTSAGTIETLAREQVRLFGGGSQVERVTVHYNPGFETSVDIILSSPPSSSSQSSDIVIGDGGSSDDSSLQQQQEESSSSSSLPELVQNGATLKESLQSLIEIDKANIYWDLSSMTLPSSSSSSTVAAASKTSKWAP